MSTGTNFGRFFRPLRNCYLQSDVFFWKLVILILCICCDYSCCASINEKCQACRLMVATFNNGLKETAKAHFGGGNTAWEVKSLGKYKTSETRLVEIMESICTNKDDFKDITGELFKEVKHQCHTIVEEHEEHIENWYFHKQKTDPNMLKWLCIDKLAMCCPFGSYGKECTPCPGEIPCSARGKCEGNGTREGSGKCTCDAGYQGKVCRQCANGYINIDKNNENNNVNCQRCDISCKGDCTALGPAGCVACKDGYRMRQEHGCADIDECQEGEPCLGENEVCTNTVGSYSCDCKGGFKKENDVCVEHIAEPAESNNTETEEVEGNETKEVLDKDVQIDEKTEL